MNNKINILIVEDDIFTSKNICLTLELQGYNVYSANSINQAEEILLQTIPNLIVMDIDLNGPIDGIDLATLINKNIKVPVVYLTNNDDERVVDKAKVMHHSIFMTKPFNKRILLSNIEMALKLGISKEIETPVEALFVKDGSRRIKIPYNKLIFLRASRAYCEVHWMSDGGNTMNEVSKSMNLILAQIPKSQFSQVHRSYVINLQMVNFIKANEVVLINGWEVPIGADFKEKVVKFFNQV